MMERRKSLDERLNDLRHDLDERIDEAIMDNLHEICEAVGRVYDEYAHDFKDDEITYGNKVAARSALFDLLKELDIDPESVRERW